MKIVLACVALFSIGCGASMEAIYEGDVRFEHCMALDARPDVKPSMRRACWAEWMAFYTYGQTRDRVQHAQMRIEQLSDPGELAPGELAPAEQPSASESRGRAVGFAPGAEDRARHNAVCSGTCEAVREDCARSCSNGGCERTCSMGFQRCMLTCG